MEMFNSPRILLALTCLLCLWGQGRGASVSSQEESENAKERAMLVPLEQLLMDASTTKSGKVPFFYSEHDHMLLTELDMLFTMEEFQENRQMHRQKRTAGIHGNGTERRWTDNTMNYELMDDFSESDLQEIYNSFDQWSHYTCLQFQETTHRDRVQIKNGDGCYSRVGMVGGLQPIGLAPGCRYKRIVLHELGHAIGLHHEQTRPDRDEHVSILLENIDDAMEYNFEKYKWSYIMNLNIPYDYHSIMHYGKTAFSNNGKVSIETQDPEFQEIIGNQEMLSFGDIKTVNTMYNCKPETCDKKDSDCPGQGFVGKDCTCWCPGYSAVSHCLEEDEKAKGSLEWVEKKFDVKRACNDEHPNDCPTWATNGFCFIYKSYMSNNCKKSCNLC